MKTATVSTLKASLSEYLSAVKAGEEVLVTERGAADCEAHPNGKLGYLAATPAKMEKQGLIKVGIAKLPKDFGLFLGPKIPRGLF